MAAILAARGCRMMARMPSSSAARHVCRAAWGAAPCPRAIIMPQRRRPQSLHQQQQQQRRGVAMRSTPTPHGIAWLDAIDFAPNFGSSSGSSGSSSSNNSNGSSSTPAANNTASALSALAGAEIDAVVMLAGGLLPDGGMPDWVSRRLDTAYDVHLLQQRRCPVLMLGGGTPHKPPIIGRNGHVLHESTACADYLISRGADPGALLKEVSSYDTVGNAYFALTIHAVPAGWRRVAVVTSAFHMPRAKALFGGIWKLAGRSLYGDDDWFELVYVSASDDGVFDDYVLQARIEKEAQAVRNWELASRDLASLADFHRWFYSDHACYAVQKQGQFGARTIKDDRLLASY